MAGGFPHSSVPKRGVGLGTLEGKGGNGEFARLRPALDAGGKKDQRKHNTQHQGTDRGHDFDSFVLRV